MSLPGIKELIIGDTGVGKTHAIRTLLPLGIQPIVLATEPGMRALAPCGNPGCSICQKTKDWGPDAIPWSYVQPVSGGVDTLMQQAADINTKTQELLCQIKDMRRGDYNQFYEVLKLYKEFVDHTGKSWGPVSEWNTDRALVLDALTETGDMAIDSFVGRRPVYDKPDYQVAQRLISNFIKLLCFQTRCHVIVLAHPEKEFNEALGVTRMTASLPGNKLSPKVPRRFDDVVIAKRKGTTFMWSTAEDNAEGKGRNLPIRADLAPDFGLAIESWKHAGGKIEATKS